MLLIKRDGFYNPMIRYGCNIVFAGKHCLLCWFLANDNNRIIDVDKEYTTFLRDDRTYDVVYITLGLGHEARFF